MPLLRINATLAGLALHDTSHSLKHQLNDLPSSDGPAIIMVHGYKYDPGNPDRCPHRKIFGDREDSWPKKLGLDLANPQSGLGIAFGWFARGPLRAVHARAAILGKELATLVSLLRTHKPDRPVHVIAHSLGSEAAISALGHLPRGAIDRMVLLTGASCSKRLHDMLATPAGRSVEILNVTSRENDLFDAAFERLVGAQGPGNRAIGQGIEAANVVNLQLDCATTLNRMRQLGYEVAEPTGRICHWSSYRRAGVMAFYSAFLRNPNELTLDHLRHVLPETLAPRWSRLFALPRRGYLTQEISLPYGTQSVGSCQPTMGAVLAGTRTNEPAY